VIPVVCVIGRSNSGKTRLMQRLVKELKRRGYRVATIKHTPHGFELDHPDTDSSLYAGAGSDAVVLSSPQSLAIMKPMDHDAALSELPRYIGADFDIILAEGFKGSPSPKIQVCGNGSDYDLLCPPEQLIALVSDEQQGSGIPEYTPDEAEKLVDLIEQRFLAATPEESIDIYIDGKPVPLNKFVRRIFLTTILGMASSLKNVPQEPNAVDISIRLRSNSSPQDPQAQETTHRAP